MWEEQLLGRLRRGRLIENFLVVIRRRVSRGSALIGCLGGCDSCSRPGGIITGLDGFGEVNNNGRSRALGSSFLG
jgi:hypothetical protein